MYTQNTPVHVNLWHRDFWFLALANMLLSFSIYMFIPAMSAGYGMYASDWRGAALTGVYCLGLFVPGPFSSYIIQRHRRNNVCLLAMALLALCTAAMYFIRGLHQTDVATVFSALMALRFLQGMMFGLAHSVLAGVLIVDKCESFLRTEANHSAAWFYRFSLSLGPLAAIVVGNLAGSDVVLLVSALCCVVAMVLVRMVKFPFKAPDENVSVLSLDRFFLPQGIRLFINQMMITTAVGLFLSVGHTAFFYGALMAGFFIALLAQKFVFVNAELRSEMLTGLLMIGSAVLLVLFRDGGAATRIAPVLTGLGAGLVGSRFLLFFIKLGNHCQRGTSQTSFFLSWESGLCVGFALGCHPFGGDVRLVVSLIFIVAAFLMYQFSTHSWYLNHRNR